MGDYLNKHFVSTYQKVGTFQIVNGQKQGGNVASYFCTPNGGLLDAIAGPVDAATLLREARWVVETRKMALLDSHGDLPRYKQFFRLAHAEQLPSLGGAAPVNWQRLPLYTPSEAALAGLLANNPLAQQLDKQGQVHLLLAVYPLVPLDQAYKVIYEKVLNEKISTRPVTVGSASAPDADSWTTSVQLKGDPLAAARRVSVSRSFTPTTADQLEDLREQSQARALRHARHDPPATEVYAATPLNVLLADLQKGQAQGARVRPVRLAAEWLPRINVTSEPTGGPTGGLLKDGGKLRWPLAWDSAPLQKPSQELRGALEALLAEAIAQARKGSVGADLLRELRGDAEALHHLLVANVKVLTPSEYVEANRYLGQVSDAVKVLGRADAAQYVNGTFALNPAHIKTVGDLIAFMAEKHLKFAPAVPGDEAAYLALQRALASCDTDGGPSLLATDRGDL